MHANEVPVNDAPFLTALALPARALHSLHHAQGLQLTCQEGCLWVTLDHDPRDIVLDSGQSFTIPSARRTLIYALEASQLTARELPGPAAATPVSRRWLRPEAAKGI
ncbi:MAG: DUF2917 domain-containing protein [Ramlibacter sp.]|nr:DUF2917 domain-containing protein [Ramlibacter sp.]